MDAIQRTVDGDALRRQLARDLISKQAIRSPEWRAAFERVPRHVFVPRFQHKGRIIDSSDPEWLDLVYSDTGLVTHVGADGHSTSSSSTPRIMAMMLEALDPHPGHRVLEIGTGTGYNAALLCERVGCEGVNSIDLDPALVQTARERLAEVGYHPAMVVGDGYHGWSESAPYDRLIGTCLAWPIPPAWIAQTVPGGRVVAVVPNGLVTLTVGTDGSASGRFHPMDFEFMYMRGHMPDRMPKVEVTRLTTGSQDDDTRRCRYPSRITQAGNRWSFWFFWGLLVTPFATVAWERNALNLVDERDRSWFRLDVLRNEVTQGGPRRLWDAIEDRFQTWCELGAPNREEFGLTVQPDGRSIMWLNSPSSEHCWYL